VENDERLMSPKVESAAVRRFATGYDKLCKNCPTRLQPRVDTLTEMILGLSEEERVELMATVESRLERGAQSKIDGGVGGGARTAKEVYDFQVGMKGASSVRTIEAKKKEETGALTIDYNVSKEKNDAPVKKGARKSSLTDLTARETKLKCKLCKSRSKLEKSRLDHSRAARLITIADLLLSQGSDASLPPSIIGANDCNAATDELRAMHESELKLQKLKYDAIRAKCEQKMAKARVKMFAANLELSRIHGLIAKLEQEDREAELKVECRTMDQVRDNETGLPML